MKILVEVTKEEAIRMRKEGFASLRRAAAAGQPVPAYVPDGEAFIVMISSDAASMERLRKRQEAGK